MARKFFALENADVVESTEAGLDGADVLELNEGIQETQVEAAEVDEIATAIEDAEVAAGNLEEAAEVLEGGVESGEGVSEETAQAVDIAVEAALNMLGASHRGSNLMPSLESWGSGHSRLASTKLALEGVADKIKEIWKKIVEFVKAIAQKVIDFFVKFFDNTDRLIKNATKMKQSVASKSDFKVKEDKIKAGSAAKQFNKGDGTANFATASDVLKTHAAVARSAKGVVSAFSAGFAAISGMINDSSKTDGLGAKLEDVIRGAAAAYGQVEETEVNGVKYVTLKGTFAGGKTMSWTADHADKGKKIPKPGFVVKEAAKEAGKEAKTLNPKEAAELLDQVIELGKATSGFKDVKGNINDMVKNTSKIADSVLKAVDEHGSMTEARTWVTSAANSVSRFVTMTPAWNVAIGNAAIGYVSASMSKWEGKDK